jgi:hypothetical protein
MQGATAIRSTSEVMRTAEVLNVDLLLFISTKTPATAMYTNPPAVNPYRKQKPFSFTKVILPQKQETYSKNGT